jgi:protocatechuate 3,4-dioxygenase beta subunit
MLTSSPAAQQSSYIEGVVTRTDGTTPIAGARVVLRKDQSVRAESDYGTMTSSDGRFVFKDVATGRYRLLVKQPGYVEAEYGQKRPNRPGSVLDLSRPLELHDIRIQMTAGSVISGRVYDQNGQPLETVQIQLVQPRYQSDGRIIPLMVSGATTNDLGEYRLYWIAPGTYYVVATVISRNPQTDTALNEQFAGTESTFVPTFYPNSFDDAHAIPIKVEAGTELRAIDLTMTRLRAVHVRGQIIDGLTGQPVPGARVSVRLKQEGWANLGSVMSVMSGLAGDFDLRRVAPGTNSFSVVMTLSGGRQASNYTDVQVGDRDISDLRLVLQSPTSISGRLLFENGEPRNGALSFSDMNGTVGYGAAVMPNGDFNLVAISPGVFRVSLNGFPDNFFIRSAVSGSRDVLREGLDTTAGPSEALEIRVASTAGLVQGNVTDDRSNPATGVQVVLIPAADRALRPDLFRNSMTDQLGHFSIRGVPPGGYKLFAWLDIEPGIYHDPGFLEPYEKLGASVQVDEGGMVSANLKVIP